MIVNEFQSGYLPSQTQFQYSQNSYYLFTISFTYRLIEFIRSYFSFHLIQTTNSIIFFFSPFPFILYYLFQFSTPFHPFKTLLNPPSFALSSFSPPHSILFSFWHTVQCPLSFACYFHHTNIIYRLYAMRISLTIVKIEKSNHLTSFALSFSLHLFLRFFFSSISTLFHFIHATPFCFSLPFRKKEQKSERVREGRENRREKNEVCSVWIILFTEVDNVQWVNCVTDVTVRYILLK